MRTERKGPLITGGLTFLFLSLFTCNVLEGSHTPNDKRTVDLAGDSFDSLLNRSTPIFNLHLIPSDNTTYTV